MMIANVRMIVTAIGADASGLEHSPGNTDETQVRPCIVTFDGKYFEACHKTYKLLNSISWYPYYMHQMSSTTEITMRLFIAAVLAGSVLAVSGMASMQPALAEKSSDKKGGDDKKFDDGHSKKIDPNMDIKNAYRDGNNLVVQVKGTAGGTVPAKPAAGHLGQVFV